MFSVCLWNKKAAVSTMSKEEKKRAQGGKVGEWREEKVGTKSHGRP